MDLFIKAEIPDRYVITCIKADNNNNTEVNFQSVPLSDSILWSILFFRLFFSFVKEIIFSFLPMF